MSRTEECILTNMCMIEDGKGNVAVQDRADPGWPGIVFPGGHAEKGEPFTDAVIREVFEETGLTIRHPRLCGVKNWILDGGERYIVLLYRTCEFSGEITSSAEGRAFWTPLATLTELPLVESMTDILQVYLHEELGELFYEGDRAVLK